MIFANYKKIVIPEGTVKTITRKSDGVILWKSQYTNQVPISTESDGITIYNGGLGYKEGYRIRSGGAEAASAAAVCTGFIPYKQGDVLRIYPKYVQLNSQNAINFSDAGFNNLGQITYIDTLYGICAASGYAAQWKAVLSALAAGTGNISTLDISGVGNAGDIAYVRVTVPFGQSKDGYVTSGADIIITVNEELDL